MSIKTALIGPTRVPAISLGTWSWGDKTWGYKPEDLPQIREAWFACLEAGYPFFDTAEVSGMGKSEEIIGMLLKETPEEERKKVVLATKWLPMPNPMNWSFFTPGIVTSLRASLERMGVDSIELYQIHSNTSYFSYDAQAKQLAEVVKQGLAKQVGVSNFSQDQLIKMTAACEAHGIKLASNQIEFNLARTLPLKNGLLQYMKEKEITCLAYSPLAMGRLTGKYSAANPPPSGRRFSNIPMDTLEPLLEVMRRIAKAHDVPVSAVALGWVMAKGAIPLGGARNKSQAEQNAKALTLKMTSEEIAELDENALEGKTSLWQQG
ncbi:hypothetical protein FFLO_01773 [Filobasidium floriforme]|uniref:NADP-dependent oxidoreductase domain-containing protein n=1 Tax=Filobasidium floriforme TaxID=5210 RepID=A0A8K0NPR5_9TREE|nr:hypothetical protein FFLO_01773 [Filobasidium floriforme]